MNQKIDKNFYIYEKYFNLLMTPIIPICIIVYLVYRFLVKKKSNLKVNAYENRSNKELLAKKRQENSIQNFSKNIKVTVATSNNLNHHDKDSIIDVTDYSFKVHSLNGLKKYSSGVPYWAHNYIYSYSALNNASIEQKSFYEIFKTNFINNTYLDLEGNSNYEFILLFNLVDEYETHKNISQTEQHLYRLSENYPKTKFYAYAALITKLKELEEFETIEVLSKKQGSFYTYHPYNSADNNNNAYYNYSGIGSKYKIQLKLNDDEVKLLNKLWYPNNNFFNIEYCCVEVLKFYLLLISELKTKYEQEGTTIETQFSAVADLIARKDFKYKTGSQNYKYCIQTLSSEFYGNIFRNCENAVRDYFGHKRKINTDTNYKTAEGKIEFEIKIIDKIKELIPRLISKVNLPDDLTEIELYSQNTTRWKIKFEELTSNYNNIPKTFVDAIIILGNLNKKNLSIENIFFEASKFIAKHDKESALYLYLHYIYQDLKSITFDNKQFTKIIQKNLFTNDEQLQKFELIVSDLIKDKNLEYALKEIPKVYQIKRKKIQLDTVSINVVQQQHSGTVQLLNEYLKDDSEEDIIYLELKKNIDNEVKTPVPTENVSYLFFIKDLAFTQVSLMALELFSKSDFRVLQKELELFAKTKGVFKNQLIESINDTCYEFLDDLLIEEEEDYYIINPNYFQSILAK